MKLLTKALAIFALAQRGISFGIHQNPNSIIEIADNFNSSCDNLNLTIYCKQEVLDTNDTNTTLNEERFNNCCRDAKGLKQFEEFKDNTVSPLKISIFKLEDVYLNNLIFLFIVSGCSCALISTSRFRLNFNFTDFSYEDKKFLLSCFFTAFTGALAARTAAMFQDPTSETSTTTGKIIYIGEVCWWKITCSLFDCERNRQLRLIEQQRQGNEEGIPLFQG